MAGKKPKLPALLKHYEVPETLPEGDFKAKCNYCSKEFIRSIKATTTWCKLLVRNYTILKCMLHNNFITEKTSCNSLKG